MASDDREVLGAVARLLREHADRLDAAITADELAGFAVRYYRRCLAEDSGGEFAETREQAAQSLWQWYVALAAQEPVPQAVLDALRRLLAELLCQGDAELSRVLVSSCLEHLFESRRIALSFVAWYDDPALRPAYEQALAWGSAFWERN